jgi:DNA-binding MarR family transcriptional regulator
MKKKAQLIELAREIDAHLRAIRRALREPLAAAIAQGGLTPPQRHIMQILVATDGLSLKELSRRAELSHSTVSGIMDRLEKRGLVKRHRDSRDRRRSRILATEKVRNFVREKLPELTVQPLVAGLRRVKPRERTAILEGLQTLRRAITGH